MQLTTNETYYRRVVNALGIGLLFFLLFLLLMSLAVGTLQTVLEMLPISDTAAKVIYQLTYGAMYLAVFMCPVPIMRAFLRGARLPWQPMRAAEPVSRCIPMIVLGGITMILAQSYINAGLVGIFDLNSGAESILPSTDGSMSNLDLVLSFIVLAVVPAFCEEFLFRGAILTNLLPFGRGTAVLVSALAFGLMHQNLAQFLYAFCAGILLGVIYEKTGSIWNGVVLHLLNNASSLLPTVLLQRLGEKQGTVAVLILDAALFLLGMLSIAVLTARVSRKPDLRDGAFGRSLPASDAYAECPVAPGRAARLLAASPFGVFLISCAVLAVLTALMLMLMGSLV